MDHERWIADEVAAKIESELRQAFGASNSVIDERKFKLVRQELYLYYPDDLLGALPYVLIGFLRFGVPDGQDWAALTGVIEFLNIKCHPYDDPRENPAENLEKVRESVRFKESAVSAISSCQARAIRLWLEAVRNCGVLDDVSEEEAAYAIAYWTEREQSRETKGNKGDILLYGKVAKIPDAE